MKFTKRKPLKFQRFLLCRSIWEEREERKAAEVNQQSVYFFLKFYKIRKEGVLKWMLKKLAISYVSIEKRKI